jgi:hypothetical protein
MHQVRKSSSDRNIGLTLAEATASQLVALSHTEIPLSI